MEQDNGFQDVLSLFSLFLGYKNLMENREQSAHNDVSAANDKQAQYLLNEISRKFDEQNVMIENIQKRLEELEIGRDKRNA